MKNGPVTTKEEMETRDSPTRWRGYHRGAETAEESSGQTATEGCHHTAVSRQRIEKREACWSTVQLNYIPPPPPANYTLIISSVYSYNYLITYNCKTGSSVNQWSHVFIKKDFVISINISLLIVLQCDNSTKCFTCIIVFLYVRNISTQTNTGTSYQFHKDQLHSFLDNYLRSGLSHLRLPTVQLSTPCQGWHLWTSFKRLTSLMLTQKNWRNGVWQMRRFSSKWWQMIYTR